MTDIENLIKRADEMRELQRKYNITRTTADWQKANHAEQIFDNTLASIKSRRNEYNQQQQRAQQQLF